MSSAFSGVPTSDPDWRPHGRRCVFDQIGEGEGLGLVRRPGENAKPCFSVRTPKKSPSLQGVDPGDAIPIFALVEPLLDRLSLLVRFNTCEQGPLEGNTEEQSLGGRRASLATSHLPGGGDSSSRWLRHGFSAWCENTDVPIEGGDGGANGRFQ